MRQYHWSDLLKTLANDNIAAFWEKKNTVLNALYSVSQPRCSVNPVMRQCLIVNFFHIQKKIMCNCFLTQRSASVEDSYLLGSSALLLQLLLLG